MKLYSLKVMMLAAAALMGLSSGAIAQTVYNFTGAIDDIRDFGGVGSSTTSQFTYGDLFTGSLSYDAGSPYVYTIQPNRDLYSGSSDPFTATIADYTVSGTSGELQLFDNYDGYDMVFISSLVGIISPELLGNANRAVLRLQLRDSSQTAVNGALPTSLNLDEYNAQRYFGLTGYASDGSFVWSLAGTISSLSAVSAVPETSTWGMMLLGFGAIGLSMRRKAKSGLANRPRTLATS